MRRLAIHFLQLLFAGFFALPALAAEALADYAGSVPLTTRGGDAIHKLELPLAVYAGVQHADLRDVRVFNAAQELVPHALLAEAPPAPPPPPAFAPPVFALPGAPGKTVDQLDVRIEQRADGSVVSIRTRSPGARPAPAQPAAAYIVDATAIDSTIAVITPQWRVAPDNYLGSARVEASDDLKHWRTVAAAAPLAYLQQGQARLVQERIEFTPTRSRYYRLSFAPAAPELEGIVAAPPLARPELRRQSLRVAGRAGANPGEVEFDLQVRAPVDRVRLIVAQSNSLAPVRLETRPAPRGEWRAVVATVAYRIVRDGQEQASPAVPVAPNPSPYWRAIVDQGGGGLGAAPPELEVSWPVRELIFLARGEGPFTLAFGRAEATAARLAPATLVPGYREGMEATFPVADSGPARQGPPPSPPMLPRIFGDADPKKAGLWAALLVGVLLLAGMAWRLARQMKAGAASAGQQSPPRE